MTESRTNTANPATTKASSSAPRVVTRFPPSPTGLLHIGGARTALFNYLFTKHMGGTMLFRFEDTDKVRSKKEFEATIFESLKWLGIGWDNSSLTDHTGRAVSADGIVRQSERTALYTSYVKKLIDSGHAYVSKEARSETGDSKTPLASAGATAGNTKAERRAEVIRFKNPNIKITFHDLIRGGIEFDTTDLGDFVIAKSLEEPIYHLAVVVDDFDMGVTHVIRGEDHISNTPRQILIQRAIGAPEPVYAHIPLILAPDRSKMSKRHGSVAVSEYQNAGYLPQAMINYLALLGWNPGTDQEILSMDELIAQFDISKVQKGGAVFNEEKLKWINKEYVKLLPESEKERRVAEAVSSLVSAASSVAPVAPEVFKKVTSLVFERAATLVDVSNEVNELRYIFEKPVYAVEALFWKGVADKTKTAVRLNQVMSRLAALSPTKFSNDDVKNSIWEFASEEGRGEVLWPMRVALSGKQKSPDPFVLAEILGKDETIGRLRNAIALLS